MAQTALDQRVDSLEYALIELAYQVRQTDQTVRRLSMEMREFKNEMKEFKNEMQEFKDEMKEFKNEMKSFKTESSKKWGELANKLGTVTEDIVGPGIPSAIQRAFNLEVIDLFIRRKRKMNGIVREYDTLAITDKHVFFVDVKSTYRPEYLIDFATTINDFFEFLPDLKEKHLVPVIASFFLDSSIVSNANKKGYLAIHISGDHLNFINPEVFKTYNL
ncbi:MAG: hypothetical protein HQK63_04550 [Desulfamplus sp.]|nr:hypothetical protein [Desulfamplus sp.]